MNDLASLSEVYEVMRKELGPKAPTIDELMEGINSQILDGAEKLRKGDENFPLSRREVDGLNEYLMERKINKRSSFVIKARAVKNELEIYNYLFT